MASAASRKAAGKRASADLEDQSKATKHLAPKPKARTTVPGSSLKALVDAGILAPGTCARLIATAKRTRSARHAGRS
jgi:hypothetical protein